jgi:hypothetical protein
LGEYFHLFFFSSFISILFFGGWEFPNFIFYIIDVMYIFEGYEDSLWNILERIILFIWWEIRFHIASNLVYAQLQDGFIADFIDYFVDIEQNIRVCNSYYSRYSAKLNV